MNTFRWIFVTIMMLPRDLKMTKDYLIMTGKVAYWSRKGWTIHQVFDKVAAKQPQKIALRLEENAWSYQMVQDFSLQIANYFKDKGLQSGDVVAIFMENRPRYVGLWLGLTRVGIIAALINTGQKMEPLAHAIMVANSKAVIIGTELIPVMEELQKTEYKLPDTIELYISGTDSATKSMQNAKNLDKELEQVKPKTIDPAISKKQNMDSKMLYIYTSGTTGLPKAAIMTYRRFAFLAVAVHQMLSMKPNDVVYTPMPLYHSSGGLVGTGQTLLFGNTMVLRQKFSATAYFSDCRKYGATVGQYIGEMASYIMARPPSPADKDHSVRLMVGNGMRHELWVDFQKRFNVKRIGEFYGSTEGNANMINSYNHPGAVGFFPWFVAPLYPLSLIQYDPETGEPIRGEDGLCKASESGKPGILIGKIKDSTTSNFQGYADKEATKKKIITDVFKKGDSYFNSGDVMKKDDYGYYYFMDRLGDTYRWKGENVAASQVEAIITKNMEMSPNNVAVYGVQVPKCSGKAGMVTIVIVNEENTETQTPDGIKGKLKEICEKNMFSAQIPIFLRITKNELPRTPTHKIKKTDLQKQGFNPDVINAERAPGTEDLIYLYSGKKDGYIILDADVYNKLVSGEIKV